MRVTIIVIGDEVLLGQVTDTNSGMLSRMLDPHGWHVDRVLTVADKPDEIRRAVEIALSLSDIVLTTGGLGPTKDDITKQTLIDIFGGELRLDQATLDNVKEVVSRRNLKLNELTAAQALVPTSCTVIQNRVGTAPIMWFESEGRVLVAMPGVPFETRQMFESAVLPMLLQRFPSPLCYRHRCIMVAGLSESEVATRLSSIEESFPPELHLAYLPRPGLLRLRLDAAGPDPTALDAVLDDFIERIADAVARENVLAYDDLNIGQIVRSLMSGTGLTLATAESCTGGNIAHTITAESGSSEYFVGSVVSYANSVKTGLLGVDQAIIDSLGAVSEPVARQMAQGARQILQADYAVATSGIAGPGGAVEGKPVGTVCFALATPQGVTSWTSHLPGTRDRVIDRATTEVLVALCRSLRQR